MSYGDTRDDGIDRTYDADYSFTNDPTQVQINVLGEQVEILHTLVRTNHRAIAALAVLNLAVGAGVVAALLS